MAEGYQAVASGGARSCSACGAWLARDNTRTMCSPCARRRTPVPPAPEQAPEFWNRSALRDAFRSRHFGQVIYAYRCEHRPVLTQARVGRWLDLTQGQISRLERSPEPTHDLAKLERWARALAIPEARLWFRFSPDTRDASFSFDDSVAAEGDGVHRRQLFKVAGVGVAAAGFRWFGSGLTSSGPRRRIGSVDVASLREMTSTFRRLDNRFGGGHARATVGEYLSSSVAPLLRDASLTDSTRADLHGAVAELHQLAGWMAYDVGDTTAGGLHLRQALRLCRVVDDDARSAEMLAGMSHQAAFFESGGLAVDLAEAAQSAARRSGVAALVAESFVMTAHGHALQGHARPCFDALRRSEEALSSAGTQDTPAWLGYFDSAYLAAKFAHCFRDLGRPADAERYARRSLEMIDGYDRGRLFNLSVLASALADQDKIDEACAVGAAALDTAGGIQSVRTVSYLADVARRLRKHRSYAAVGRLEQRMTDSGIVTVD